MKCNKYVLLESIFSYIKFINSNLKINILFLFPSLIHYFLSSTGEMLFFNVSSGVNINFIQINNAKNFHRYDSSKTDSSLNKFLVHLHI